MNWLTIAGLTGLQNGINAYMNERNNRANMKLAEYKYQKDLEMWNLQNQFNDPVHQMKRLQEAGLSPHLVYGGGNVTGNSAGSPPQYAAPRLNATQIPDLLGQYMSAKNTNQSNRLLDAQVSQVQAQTLNTLAMTPGLEADAEVKKAGASVALELANQTKEQASLTTQKMREELSILGLEKVVKNFEAELANRGFNKSDSVWIRQLIQSWEELSGQSIESISETPTGKRISRIVTNYENFARGGKNK